jgi:hypothetical protein
MKKKCKECTPELKCLECTFKEDGPKDVKESQANQEREEKREARHRKKGSAITSRPDWIK